MLPLLLSSQIREADAYTIAHEPLSSTDLMERAAKAFVGWFINRFPEREERISIYCGTGNNGGDGLAIARLLHDHGYTGLKIYIARYNSQESPDFLVNLQRLTATGLPIRDLKPGAPFEQEDASILIGALLGTGLSRPLAGDFERLVRYLNGLKRVVVSVDIPAGLVAEGEMPVDAVVLRSDLVITFQQPKISFLLPESGAFIGCWQAVNIGIDEGFIRSLRTPYQFVEEKDIRGRLKPRRRFSNKGTYGHALILAGSPKTMGAALLAASSCVSTGAGLTTACVPKSGLTALNSYMPEIMAIVRDGNALPDIDWSGFSVAAVGPGLGRSPAALALFTALLQHSVRPVVIDADGLNLLSEHPELWEYVPRGSVITPHMKEFDRLFGPHDSWWQRLQTARKKAAAHRIHILLKNDYSITITPEDQLFFNSTGNPAMASGGMGDVLTGVIAGLMAQGYGPADACMIGAYVHGRAADELALPGRLHVVIPSRVSAQLPVTLARLMA